MASVRSATSYEVKIGDTVFKQSEADALESLVLEDHVDMVEALTVRVGGHEQAKEWNFEIGMPVEAKLGAGAVLMFKGEVTALEPSWSVEGVMTMTIRAYDHTHRLARGRKTRWFNDKSDTDIAKSVGSECGLDVRGPFGRSQRLHPATQRVEPDFSEAVGGEEQLSPDRRRRQAALQEGGHLSDRNRDHHGLQSSVRADGI